MNVIDNAALAQNIKDGIAQAQSLGLVLEDHLPGIIDAAVDAELAKLPTVLKPVLDALAPIVDVVANLQITLDLALREALAWRQMFERINLSPPKKL